ncbi:V-type H+-transporting ATPase subunit a [Nematocida sp. AWRm80]|nr:V-type H+-transporting ATPase subunit a [Nematocida sp. AWRm80]
MLRSEDVIMVRIYISPDIYRDALEEFANKEMIHLVGNNDKKIEKSAHRLAMEKELTRIEFMLQTLKRKKIPLGKPGQVQPLNTTISKMSEEIEKHYYRIVQLTQIMKETSNAVDKLQEDMVVLQEVEKAINEGIKESEFELDIRSHIELEYVAGVIKKGEILKLEKFLWRSLHGNLYFIPIEMTAIDRTGFICFSHGARAIERIKGICTKIDARIVKCGGKSTDLLQLSSDLRQLTKVHELNTETLSNEIKTISRELNTWKYYIIREIELEIARDKLEINKENSYLTGHAFILKKNEERFGRLIKKIGETHGDVAAEIIPVPEGTIKPTHFTHTKLTAAFQDLTNVYGIPTYKEINPTIFSVTTLPFLFGAMFGDVGHGLIILAIGIYFIKKENTLKIPKSIELIFEGRYLMLFMGMWSMYFGFIYGDFMGCSFGEYLSAYSHGTKQGTCYFGIDTIWHKVSNGPSFINSLKMKMSIVLGFFHIILGMVLNMMNAYYRKDLVQLLGMQVPQLIVFVGLIGYMVFLVFLKWCTPRDTWPGIISIIIDMASFNTVPPESLVYPGQNIIQKLIMFLVIISVPVMLLSEPLYAHSSKNKKKEMGEIWMHSIVEGIEFLMGLISNISSYLRLWAVSLAHAELSGILYTKTIGNTNASILIRLSSSIIWFLLTMVLLIGLEGLSATLHSLRLHWVEFGSKFYKGEGLLFTPLSFKPNSLLDPERQPGGERV